MGSQSADIYNSQHMPDSPMPSFQSNHSSNSLRKTWESLMGKKNHKTLPLAPNASKLSVEPYEENDEYSMTSRGDSFHSDLGDVNIFNAEFPFEIVTPSRTYLLCSIDAYSFNDWLEHLQNITFGKKIYGGWLTKQGSKNKSWKKRWFVIFDTREIRYYESDKTKIEKGSIILDDLQIMNLLEDKAAKKDYKKKNVFELVCGGRKWVLISNSKEERELWFNRVVQVVPNVQRLDPLYSNELSYKRNDRAKKWMKGYFAMDVEYLFFFKDKKSFDTFKSSAYFQEDLYTLALAQHVQGLIPLRNRKIKELDRNHPACSGKNKFVFSLKTSAGEFFLSTQYSIQMDDWLDAFRELYRLEIQEKRQGKMSRRRQHSNSFGRRPPSPPHRSRRQSAGRSISPSPSGPSPTANKYAKVDEANKHKGKIKKVWNMPETNGIVQTAKAIKVAPKSSSNNQRSKPKRKMKPRRKSKVNVVATQKSDSESPEATEQSKENGHKRRKSSTPFRDIDSKMAQRRRSRGNMKKDEALYDISTKNVQKLDSKQIISPTPALDEGNEGSSGDSDHEKNKVNGKKVSKYKRKKRKEKVRNKSVGTVLKEKVINMTRSSKKNKNSQKKAKERKKTKERERKIKEEKRKKEQQKKENLKKKKKAKKNRKEI